MRKGKFVAIIVAIILLLMIGVPIAINEVYKFGDGYITKWDAADVLSYYGAMVGATATATAMTITISFTYKQIRRDSYLKNETEKWSKIEFVFADALNTINPIRSHIETMDSGQTSPEEHIKSLQKYQICCKTSVDQLNAYLNTKDYPKVKSLIDAIIDFSEKITQIAGKEVAEYSKLSDLNSRASAQKSVDMEMKSPGSVPEEILSFSKSVLENTKGIHYDDVQTTIRKLNEQMVAAYQESYRPLLQLKGMTFEVINAEIQREADNILHLWRKHKCPPSNGSEKTK